MHIVGREGNMLTFEELYAQYAQEVYRFTFWLSGSEMDAEDITAETLVRAWLRFGSIRMETVKGYLLKIARNLYLAKQRKSKHSIVLVETHPDPAPGPESVAQTRLSLAEVKAFLRRLPECDRTAFILRVQYDLSYSEIARVLEVSEVAARVKVHRTRKRLLQEKAQDGTS
jgi:RNA polymerase sigma-70 factor (ECF subfamily)